MSDKVNERDDYNDKMTRNIGKNKCRGKVEDLKQIKSEKIQEVVNTKKSEIIEGTVKEAKPHQGKLNDLFKSNVVELVKQINGLSGRVTALEVSLTAMSKVLDVKGVVSQDDINVAIEKEQQRLQAYQQVQCIQGNYRVRLEMCKKWGIKVDTTDIVSQLKEDSGIDEQERIKIAAEYGIDVRLFIQKVN